MESSPTPVIPRLALELHNELPELKGFSERNIKRMLAFYREYPSPDLIVPQAATQLHTPEKVPQPVAQLTDTLPSIEEIEAELSKVRPLRRKRKMNE
jgi:hypothetical protein